MTRQYRPKTCKTCGNTYTPTGPRQEYCPGCGGGGGRKRTNAESARRTRAARTPGALRAMARSAQTRRISYERHKDEPEFKERVRERNRQFAAANPDYWRDRRRRREEGNTETGEQQ